jgi:hypothetical protein
MLIPDLGADRVRVAPETSEARGMEFSLRQPLSQSLDATGTLAWSSVADDFGTTEQVRSWNQPLALTAGLSWNGERGNVSLLGGWHQGWPRTPAVTGAQDASLVIGARNSQDWKDYWTLDLRASWQQRFTAGELSYFAEVTNSANHHNPCCTSMETPVEGAAPELEVTDWLPLLVNVGITFRWGSGTR